MVAYSNPELTGKLFNEAKILAELHSDEVSHYGDYEIDGLSYLSAVTSVFVMRDNGVMVGYVLYLLHNHPHHLHMSCASQDTLFVHPDYRKGLAAMKFLKYTEKELKKLDIDRIFRSTTTKRDLGVLYKRMGYTETDVVYSKEL